MRLLAVPGASVRRAQRGHQGDQMMKSFSHRHPYYAQSWTPIIPGSRQASIGWRGLRLSRAYGRVLSLHLERGKGLWPQNRNKDLSFGIGGAGVDPTVSP